MSGPATARRASLWLPCVAVAAFLQTAVAESGGSAESLTDMPLEKLLATEVTSVSRQARPLAASAAAVYVLRQEDIRRSGATTIPEALRLVPGVQVARVDRDRWAITARGFNDLYANKLLVMIDGRSVYTPLFSGVWWDNQDTMLEDVERIEVIRGPGASLWGSNAVNGVINIITKNANETRGGLLSASAGNLEHGTVGLRYGGHWGEGTDWRVFGKYFDRDAYDNASGKPAGDDWRASRGGFRLDSRLSADDQLSLSGEMFHSDSGGTTENQAGLTPPYNLPVSGDQKSDGYHLLSRWKHKFTETSDFALQLYYDHNRRSSASLDASYEIDVFDLDFQHDVLVFDHHRIIWGSGYRYLSHETRSSPTFNLNPDEREDHQFAAFLQDEIALIPDRVHLTLGTKLEHRTSQKLQVQPNVRLLWTPNRRTSLWAAISRAVRLPSWSEQDSHYRIATYPPQNPDPRPILWTVNGSRDLKPEELIAYELGYRTEWSKRLSTDLALFYNDYDRLRSYEDLPLVDRGSYFELPVSHANHLKGQTYGAELSANWQAADFLRFRAGYSYLKLSLKNEPGKQGYPENYETRDPQQQFFMHGSLDLTSNTQFDLMLRYVDETPQLGLNDYITLDARLAWSPLKNLELSLTGRNLTDSRHYEFNNSFGYRPTQVTRDFYANLRWSF
ncbi:TonB-dependent siderophore receptor [Methylococcus sp. EFPC2]|uniref:TonB-dependent receptor plug domain-containing protein n=1 Tax=Methylococcus sp. EFPC2 TaxID=2812648 RepID=UPI00196811A2|nr:TonB-dependent receptor [Methylococcus sp. EFPC2]QSA96473.1 TonB-dependent receptor [Methylococcus sp. EFPC2]